MTETARPTNQRLTIRMAAHTDSDALTRLAQLDSAAPVDVPAGVLVAEIDGELVAALPREGRGAIANPFRRTAGVVALLEARAAELNTAVRRPRSRSRLFHWLGAPVAEAEQTAPSPVAGASIAGTCR